MFTREDQKERARSRRYERRAVVLQPVERLAEMAVLYAVKAKSRGDSLVSDSAGPVHSEFPGPWAVLEGGEAVR
jgi:hypothetical protein